MSEYRKHRLPLFSDLPEQGCQHGEIPGAAGGSPGGERGQAKVFAGVDGETSGRRHTYRVGQGQKLLQAAL